MWAMIPMFRVLSSGYSRATRLLPLLQPQVSDKRNPLWPVVPRRVGDLLAQRGCRGAAYVRSADCPLSQQLDPYVCFLISYRSPPVVGERLVRLGHLVRIVLLLHRIAPAVRSVDE